MTASIALVVLGPWVSGTACSSFEEEPAPDTTDASGAETAPPTEGGPIDSGSDSPTPPSIPVTCPLPRGPSCALLDCEERLLHDPPVGSLTGPLVMDAASVYWLETPQGGAARLLRASKKKPTDPKTHASVLADGQPTASLVALDGRFVYWLASPAGDTNSAKASVRRIDRTCTPPCGAPEELLSLPAGQVRAFVRAAEGVLFVAYDHGDVIRLSVSAGGITISPVVLTNTGGNPSLVVVPPFVYGAGTISDSIQRVGIDGLAPSTVGAGRPDGGFIASLGSDCQDIIVGRTGSLPYTLDRLVGDGSAYSLIAETNTFVAETIAVDQKYIYVRNTFSGVFAVDRASDAGYQPVASAGVRTVHVDDDGAYWSELDFTYAPNSGRVHMRVK